jgi:FkbM family methyltransferase
MKTVTLDIPGIGEFLIPAEPEERRKDSEFTVKSVCGWQDAALAASNGEWGDRCGQEYSYRRKAVEDVRTVLDIGCNVGAFAVWARRYWWPNLSNVYMYDPNFDMTRLSDVNTRGIFGATILPITKAVTTNPAPLFREHVHTGRSHTWGDREANPKDGWKESVPVPAIHPRDLPPADAMKVDAEGVELEIFEHYAHWSQLKVVAFEWHSHENRIGCQKILEAQGMVCVKDDCGESDQGVAVWVRP